MTRRQKQRFRRLLLKRRAELRGEIKARQDVLSVEYVGDTIDRVQQRAEREAAARNVDRLSTMLKSVEGALKEIEAGTFGVCAACDKPIPLKRLESVPWSPYCIRCQELAERTGEDRLEFQMLDGLARGDAVDLRRPLAA